VVAGPRQTSSAFAALVAAYAIALTATGGCGEPARPGELPEPSRSEAGSTFFVTDASPGAPTCNLGSSGHVCACVDQPLLGQVPNLYFVLDRSGSMNDDNKWGTIVDVLGQLVIQLGPRVNIGIAVFPAPAGGPNTCAAGVPVIDLSPGDPWSAQLGPTATRVLNELGRIGAQGGTPTAATLTNLLPLLKTYSGKTYVVLATDGGPNCNASASCSAAQCQLDIESTPGCSTSTNCCAVPGGELSCLDADPTTAAVSALVANGFPVYVVGIPGSAPYATLLDALATAGGTARDPIGPGPQYYNVATTDEQAFESALFRVAARVAGHCELTLDEVPPNPDLVNVFLNGVPLATGAGCIDSTPVEASANDEGGLDAGMDSAPEPAEGGATEPSPSMEASDSESEASTCSWILRGQTVTILGDTCQSIMAGDILDVRVVAGCPTVIH
jgi:hypothetical protein